MYNQHPISKPKTIFIDWDGTCVRQMNPCMPYPMNLGNIPELLPGVRDKITKWSYEGHKIIITTARKGSYREETIRELKYHKIVFDQLVMDLTTGQRIVINDTKPEDTSYDMAKSWVVDRDTGIEVVTLDTDTEE